MIGSQANAVFGGEVVTAMLAASLAEQLCSASDQQVNDTALDLLAQQIPDVARRVVGTHVVRRTQAMPKTPIGRARSVQRYRAELASDSRSCSPGTTWASPGLNSAAWNGRWAADHLYQALRSGALTS